VRAGDRTIRSAAAGELYVTGRALNAPVFLASFSPTEGWFMTTTQQSLANEPQWTPQPDAAQFIAELVDRFMRQVATAQLFAQRLHELTGTRLIDWVDHLLAPATDELVGRLAELSFEPDDASNAWRHPRGMFPPVLLDDSGVTRISLKVESVADFLFVQRMAGVPIEGCPLAPLRRAKIAVADDHELWIVERHGAAGFAPVDPPRGYVEAALAHREALRRRARRFADDDDGFTHALALIEAAKADLGVDWTCDAFFAAEREYWQSRNLAARVQKARQDSLGMGWANHDHHTYRSSRARFPQLIALLESLGMECRERFYAGREAGWGAQVLQQHNTGVVVFADIDLSPEDLLDDFAHQPLPERTELGTVGLWCALHGEAILQAGMHHLECQFDFNTARGQLEQLGVTSMAPFTNFDYLKQSFTTGEIWPVDSDRIERALSAGWIDVEQARQFLDQGAVGSHLEILQRDDGYKGFNQTGISDVIKATDPRNQAAARAG
jgi:hypothetical protein